MSGHGAGVCPPPVPVSSLCVPGAPCLQWEWWCVAGSSLLCFHGAAQPFSSQLCGQDQVCVRRSNGKLRKGLNGLVYLGGRGRVLKSIKLMVGVWQPSGQLSDLTPHCQALEAVGSGGRWCWSSARFTPRGRTATARPTCGWVWWPGRGWEVDIQM